MNMPKILPVLVPLFTMLGCASSHNLSEDNFNALGGGYTVTPLHEDLYFIEAKTNFAPWKNFGAAERMWNEQAANACEGRSYSELEIKESTYENAPRLGFIVRYVISVREGYAFCSDASISLKDVDVLIRERANQSSQTNALKRAAH